MLMIGLHAVAVDGLGSRHTHSCRFMYMTSTVRPSLYWLCLPFMGREKKPAWQTKEVCPEASHIFSKISTYSTNMAGS